MTSNFKLKIKQLDPKLKVTQTYFLNLEIQIQEISKRILAKDEDLSEAEFKLIADYALATLHDDWETLRNRGYSLLHNFCWKYWYGDVTKAIDPYGYTIEFKQFGSQAKMWNVDHSWPFSQGGLTVIENGIPISYQANEVKGASTSGQINGRNYKVEPVETKQGLIGKLLINGIEFKPQGSF